MDLRRVRYFVVLAEELHFGRAAARLGMSQPPLSQQIQLLERELGARLLARSNRRVELTTAGSLFLAEARRLLAQAAHAAEVAARAERGEVGELRIGFTSSAVYNGVIPGLILRFRQIFPMVALTLQEQSSQPQLAAMAARRLDIAFIRNPGPPDLPDGFGAVFLFRDPLMAVLHGAHPLARQPGALQVAALAEENFVMHGADEAPGFHGQVLAVCRRAGFTPRVAQEARENPTIVGLVAAGLGVALLPGSMELMGLAGVAYRPLADAQAVSDMWLVHRDPPDAAEAAFVGIAREAAG